MIKFLGYTFLSTIILTSAFSILDSFSFHPARTVVKPILNKYPGYHATRSKRYGGIIKLASLEGHPFCTASVIDDNYAVTAGHCLNENGKLREGRFLVVDNNGDKFDLNCEAYGFNDRSDLGLVECDFRDFKTINFNFTDYGFANQKYLACGYPYGQQKLICNPFIHRYNKDFLMYGQGYLVPGMSGGPVFDAATGIAVGVNSAVDDGGVLIAPVQGFLGLFGLEPSNGD